MSLRASIKEIVISGSHVEHGYKKNPKDWVVEVKLYHDEIRDVYIISIGHSQERISDIDDAVDRFCSLVYSPKNLYLVRLRAMMHGLGEIDFEDESAEGIANMKEICKRYRNEFFALDFPEFTRK